MRRFQVLAKPSAAKEFNRLPAVVRERFLAGFDFLEEDPFTPRPGLSIEPLQGGRGERKMRIGDYRGIYIVDGGIVRFKRFGHRSTVYR